MKINDVAKLTGVTVRTLHYYDEIGLLCPNETTEVGYRIYHEDSLEKLQQILFFRELDFSLTEIKEIMNNPKYDKWQALQNQKELLLKKQQRLGNLIALLDKTIAGGMKMSFEEFDMTEIKTMKKKYADEVKERWGNTEAYEESERKTASLSPQQWDEIKKDNNKIFQAFAEIRNLDPQSEEAQKLVEAWQNFISENFYHCTDEILAGLGMMYVADERFTKNIDQYGEGTAQFISHAIAYYCKK